MRVLMRRKNEPLGPAVKNSLFLRTKTNSEHALLSDCPVIASANTPQPPIRRANGSLFVRIYLAKEATNRLLYFVFCLAI